MRNHTWQSVLRRWTLILLNSWKKLSHPNGHRTVTENTKYVVLMLAVVVCVCMCTPLLYFRIWILEYKMYSYHENRASGSFICFTLKVLKSKVWRNNISTYFSCLQIERICAFILVCISNWEFLVCILGSIVYGSIYQYFSASIRCSCWKLLFLQVFLDYH